MCYCFRIGDTASRWVWNDYPFIAIILALIAMLTMVIWVNIEEDCYGDKPFLFLVEHVRYLADKLHMVKIKIVFA